MMKKYRVIVFFLFICTSCTPIEEGLSRLIEPILGEGEVPRVLFSFPHPGQKNVSERQQIGIFFNREMQSQRCIGAFGMQPFTLGFFDVAGPQLLFTPANPFKKGTYVFNMTKQCEDLNGRDLETGYIASFAVGTDGTTSSFPEVTSMQTFSGTAAACAAGTGSLAEFYSSTLTTACTGNPGINPITIHFSKSMNRNATQSAFSIAPTAAGTFSWNADSNQLTFTPDSLFIFGQRYDITISSSAVSQQEENIATAVAGSFVAGSLDTTAPTVTNIAFERAQSVSADGCVAPPNDILLAAAGASTTEVCLVTPIVITFDEDMNQTATSTATTFSPSITANYAWAAANQLQITPLGSGFAPNVNYSLKVSTSATDLAGNQLPE
ncbi:MAG: Ig-like domain-containing protein [Spirochaetales bacterium]|nr:Ig-like domain-containing protein [Spirochaetales bacterium]